MNMAHRTQWNRTLSLVDRRKALIITEHRLSLENTTTSELSQYTRKRKPNILQNKDALAIFKLPFGGLPIVISATCLMANDKWEGR